MSTVDREPMPPVHIRVTTFNVDNDEVYSERVIDYTDPHHRKWLGSHTMWAMTNKKTVELTNVIDTSVNGD